MGLGLEGALRRLCVAQAPGVCAPGPGPPTPGRHPHPPGCCSLQISAACDAVAARGFINYFGLQRFGTGGAPTHEVRAVGRVWWW